MGGRGGVAVLGLLGGGGCVSKQPSTMPNVVGGWFLRFLLIVGHMERTFGREIVPLGRH